MGKTAMAQMLALSHLHEDHNSEFIWAKSIKDILTAYDENKIQAFILDDFWGAIFYSEHTSRNCEVQFEKLVRRIIHSSGNQKLILTTREYVLQQGMESHPSLRGLIKEYGLVCALEEYSDREKSNILFSHLYHSDIKYDAVVSIFTQCDRIVYHPNYNPRVLAQFLHSKSDQDLSAEDYFWMLMEYLDDPSDFWEEVFIELSEEAKLVAMLLFISSTPMMQGDLELCYQKYIYGNPAKKALSDCIAELEQTLIRTSYLDDWNMLEIQFLSPAIQDFIQEFMKKNCEQYVPVVLDCICFYNQYLFLLEHQASAYSQRILDSLVECCICHYEDLEDCYSYDPDEYYIEDTFEYDDSGDLKRFFLLLRVNGQINSPALHKFLEQKINDYCQTMGSESEIGRQYIDLWNLPDILVRCENSGIAIHMDKRQLIQNYYDFAFSIHHYSSMKEFAKVYPEEFESIYQKVSPKIKKGLKQRLVDELYFLEDENMEFQFDILLDGIPDILMEYGLQYTKSFEKQLLSNFGRKPIAIEQEKDEEKAFSEKEKKTTGNETVERAMEEAENWLFGPTDPYFGEEGKEDSFSDEIKTLIDRFCFEGLKKQQLVSLLTEGPNYIQEMFCSEKGLQLLSETLQCSETTHFEVSETNLFLSVLKQICKSNWQELTELIACCAECFLVFCSCSEPVIRLKAFYNSDVYKTYLQDNPSLQQKFFAHFALLDDQWIRFIHVPLFIFCFACMVCMDEKNVLKEWSDVIWKECGEKYKVSSIKNPEKDSVFFGFGAFLFQNLDWEHCLCRMFEQINPYRYNREVLEPLLAEYWKQLGDGDQIQKAVSHIRQNQIRFDFDGEGNFTGGACSPEPCIIILEYLGVDVGMFSESASISPSLLARLKENKNICCWNEYSNDWTVLLYKIEEVDLLAELHVFEKLQEILQKLEYYITRFQEGNYSVINGEERNPVSAEEQL